jgi:hypothetical protein
MVSQHAADRSAPAPDRFAPPSAASQEPEHGAFDGITPGPWRWDGYPNRSVSLVSAVGGIPYVMAFRRKGMNGAEPEFWDRSAGGDPTWNGVHCTASERAIYGRNGSVVIDCPDARLIAAAPVLLDLVRRAVALDPHSQIAAEFDALRRGASR